MLIDVFKDMIELLEGHCTVDDINEIRAYLNNKIIKAQKRAVDKLKLPIIKGTGEFISVPLPSLKKKLTAQSITNVHNNCLDIKSSFNDRLNQSFNTIIIGLTKTKFKYQHKKNVPEG